MVVDEQLVAFCCETEVSDNGIPSQTQHGHKLVTYFNRN